MMERRLSAFMMGIWLTGFLTGVTVMETTPAVGKVAVLAFSAILATGVVWYAANVFVEMIGWRIVTEAN